MCTKQKQSERKSGTACDEMKCEKFSCSSFKLLRISLLYSFFGNVVWQQIKKWLILWSEMTAFISGTQNNQKAKRTQKKFRIFFKILFSLSRRYFIAAFSATTRRRIVPDIILMSSSSHTITIIFIFHNSLFWQPLFFRVPSWTEPTKKQQTDNNNNDEEKEKVNRRQRCRWRRRQRIERGICAFKSTYFILILNFSTPIPI